MFKKTDPISIIINGTDLGIRPIHHSWYSDHAFIGKILLYHFIRNFEDSKDDKIEYLEAPFGNNLLTLLITNKEIRNIAGEFFKELGLQLVTKPGSNEVAILFLENGEYVDIPFSMASDTHQRIIFYLAAILSNKDKVLLFEEPESHVFPFYNKYLGELITDDETNQFFIATHNPYFLTSIVETSKKKELGLFITTYEDHQTKIHEIPESRFDDVVEYNEDIFLNLELFIG